jgi:hypothetical protein
MQYDTIHYTIHYTTLYTTQHNTTQYAIRNTIQYNTTNKQHITEQYHKHDTVHCNTKHNALNTAEGMSTHHNTLQHCQTAVQYTYIQHDTTQYTYGSGSHIPATNFDILSFLIYYQLHFTVNATGVAQSVTICAANSTLFHLCQKERFVCSSVRPDRLWGPKMLPAKFVSGFFHGNKAAGAWCRPLTSIRCRC